MTTLTLTHGTPQHVSGDGEEFSFNTDGDFVETPPVDPSAAAGGTELMYNYLMDHLPDDLKNKCQIIPSRIGELDDRPEILWLHDTYNDPEVAHLKEPGSADRFDRIVFVSYLQMQSYMMAYNLDPEKCLVLRNAIVPFEPHEKPEGVINLIYHTTPHRGLEILVPVFEKLCENFDNIHLDVYSSFNAYGWGHRDVPYEALFDRCREHKQITYHGFQPNNVVREALKIAHVFAYPCIWPETSCISAIEASAAACEVICPAYAALPETLAGFATMYQRKVDANAHAQLFYQILGQVLTQPRKQHEQRFSFQAMYFNSVYNWESRLNEWIQLIESI